VLKSLIDQGFLCPSRYRSYQAQAGDTCGDVAIHPPAVAQAFLRVSRLKLELKAGAWGIGHISVLKSTVGVDTRYTTTNRARLLVM